MKLENKKKEILKMIKMGKTYQNIADMLNVSKSCVYSFCNKIKVKTKYSVGTRPGDNSEKIAKFVSKNGVNSACKEFKKTSLYISKSCSRFKARSGFDSIKEFKKKSGKK